MNNERPKPVVMHDPVIWGKKMALNAARVDQAREALRDMIVLNGPEWYNRFMSMESNVVGMDGLRRAVMTMSDQDLLVLVDAARTTLADVMATSEWTILPPGSEAPGG